MHKKVLKYSIMAFILLFLTVGCEPTFSGCSLTSEPYEDIYAPYYYLKVPEYYSMTSIRYPTNAYFAGAVQEYDSDIEGVYYSLDGVNYTIIPGTANLPAYETEYVEHPWSNWIALTMGQTNIYLRFSDVLGNSDDEIVNIITTDREVDGSFNNYVYPPDFINGTIEPFTFDEYYAYLFEGKTYRIYTTNNVYETGFEANTILSLEDSLGYVLSINSNLSGFFTEITQTITNSAQYKIEIMNRGSTNTNLYYALGIELIP